MAEKFITKKIETMARKNIKSCNQFQSATFLPHGLTNSVRNRNSSIINNLQLTNN